MGRRQDPVRVRGLSLAEVAIAMGLLAAAAIPSIQALIGAPRQAHQLGRQLETIGLSQRVGQEQRQVLAESLRDPRVPPPPPSGSGLVTADGNPFFDPIEDHAPRLGRLEPAFDPGVTPEFATLHRALGDLQIGVTSQARALSTTWYVQEITVTSSIETGPGRRHEERFRFDCPVWSILTEPPKAFVLEADRDSKAAEALYPDDPPTTPLEDRVAARGGLLDLLRAFGVALAIPSTLASTALDHTNKLLQLEDDIEDAPDDVTRARLMIQKANLVEARAVEILGSIVLASRQLDDIAEHNLETGLGTPPPDALAGGGLGLLTLAALPGALASQLMTLEELRRELSNPPVGERLTPWVRSRQFRSFIETHQLRLILAGPDEMDVLIQALDDFARYQEGRNPALEIWAQRELERSASREILTVTDVDPDRVRALSELGRQVETTLERLQEALEDREP